MARGNIHDAQLIAAGVMNGNTYGSTAQQGGTPLKSPQFVDRATPLFDNKTLRKIEVGNVHQILEMFGNLPVIGVFFNAINAGIYVGEGDFAGSMQALLATVADLIPGGGEAVSSVKISEHLGQAAEKFGYKFTDKELAEAGEKVAAKQAEKRAEKEAEKQAEERAEKQKKGESNKKDKDDANGGQAKGKNQEQCKGNVAAGNPVNPLTGVKFLTGEEDLDFRLPSALPVVWQRNYFSDLEHDGWLGQGWSLPFSASLERKLGGLYMVDVQGNQTRLPTLELGGECKTLPQANFGALWEANGRFRLSAMDGSTKFIFASLNEDAEAVGIIPLVAIEDRFGNTIRITYDHAGLPTQIRDEAGHVLDLEFASIQKSNGQVLRRLHRVLLGKDVLIGYAYSGEGDLVAVRNADGQITRAYSYKNHIMVGHSQPGALAARYEYGDYTPKGKVLRIENNAGQRWAFRYLSDRTEITNPLGQKECLIFNEHQVVVESIDAAGHITRTDVDGKGNAVKVTDPGGGERFATYDMRGNVTSTTDQSGCRAETLHHPVWQRPTLIVDKLGSATRFEFDATGNLIRTTDPLGHSTQYTYDKRGQIVEIIDARGGRKTAAYDELGHMISQTDCSNRTTRYEWDDWGHPRSITNALGETTRYWHDRKGRLLKTERADGSGETYRYDVHGRLVEHTDALGARTQWELTVDGLPSARVDALGHRLQYEYDAARRLTVLTNENGAKYRFSYDATGNLIEEQGFDGRIIRYRRDVTGLLTERMEVEMPDGQYNDAQGDEGLVALRIQYERDAVGRVVATTALRACDGRIERTTSKYDEAGRLIEAVNPCCSLSLGYDATGRLISESTEVLDRTFEVTYDHDELGNHISTTLPDGRKLNYLFYGSGHLHQINLDGEVISDIERDALHREVSRTQGRLTSYYQYDDVGRFVGQRTLNPSAATEHALPVIARTYEYDRSGNLQRVSDQQGDVREYRYDPLGQLIQADREIFSFDPAHNMLNPGTSEPLMDNRIKQFGDRRYVYDAQGNMVEKCIGAKTKMRFEYSLANQIERVHITNASGTTKAEYGYDALRRRVFKRTESGVTFFVWENNRLLCEVDEHRMYVYVYEHNSFVPLAQIESLSEPV